MHVSKINIKRVEKMKSRDGVKQPNYQKSTFQKNGTGLPDMVKGQQGGSSPWPRAGETREYKTHRAVELL